MRKHFPKILVVLTAVTLCISGCSSSSETPKYPSINYSGTKEYNTGQIVWRDLVTPDPKLAAEFYRNVFGWTSQQIGTEDHPYWIFKSNGKPVAGMFLMAKPKNDAGGEWIPYYSVNSVDDFSSRCKTEGGGIAIKPTEVSGRGKVALLSDPQGALFAVIKSSNGDPTYTKSDFDFLWNELWSNDIDKSADFYKKLFNAQIESKTDDERPYIVILNNDKPCSGIIKNPAEQIKDYWVPYIKVPDVHSIEQKAKDKGGKILIAADSTIRNGTVSVFLDPTGAPLAIQKWDN